MDRKRVLIDKHCHLLPQLDDGAKSLDESARMLEAMWEQGSREIWLTPHFYAHQESLDSFLARRRQSYESLKPILEESPFNGPSGLNIHVGAEVYLSPALPGLVDPGRLAIMGTGCLLLELPWTDDSPETVYRAVEAFSKRYDGQIILAHIERYAYLYQPPILQAFADLGLEFQCNLELVYYPAKKREQIYDYMRAGWISHLGSDAHNMGVRRPVIAEPLAILAAAVGSDRLSFMAGERQQKGR